MEEIPNCPACGNNYLAIRTDISKDGREFIYCDCCGALATRNIWEMANKIVEDRKKEPFSFDGRCEKHISSKPCQYCADEEEAKKSLSGFKPFVFKNCSCATEGQQAEIDGILMT